jgi:hypothetical protein
MGVTATGGRQLTRVSGCCGACDGRRQALVLAVSGLG